jgi:hypothetical protein
MNLIDDKRDPKTNEDWQHAVDLAEFYLHLDSARKYGLVTGGPHVDVARCEEILHKGRRRGITPSPDAIERILDGIKKRGDSAPPLQRPARIERRAGDESAGKPSAARAVDGDPVITNHVAVRDLKRPRTLRDTRNLRDRRMRL